MSERQERDSPEDVRHVSSKESVLVAFAWLDSLKELKFFKPLSIECANDRHIENAGNSGDVPILNRRLIGVLHPPSVCDRHNHLWRVKKKTADREDWNEVLVTERE